MLERLHQLKGIFNNPFRGIQAKPELREKLNAVPAPTVRYVIFFTPRSGSSRLTDLMESAGGCGIPGEYFNPLLIKRAATFLGAQGLPDYIDLLSRRKNTGAVFGCELTSSHLYTLFYSHKRFFSLYQPTASLFLIREDIVAQAVSLTRMNQTGVAHTLGETDSPDRPVEFQYKPGEIRVHLHRLLAMERQLERIFRLQGIEPLRLSYETLTTLTPEKFVPRIAACINATCDNIHDLESEHRKTGGERSREYIERFSNDNRALLEKVTAARRYTLAQLAEHRDRYFE